MKIIRKKTQRENKSSSEIFVTAILSFFMMVCILCIGFSFRFKKSFSNKCLFEAKKISVSCSVFYLKESGPLNGTHKLESHFCSSENENK